MKEQIQKLKKFSTNCIEQDLKDFEKDKNNFIKKFLLQNESHNVSTENDVYSLLLSTAIICDNVNLIEEILSKDRGNILTCVDSFGYSPISTALYHPSKHLLNIIKKYIESYILNKNYLKTNYDEDDKNKILTVMRYPQIEDLEITDECVNTYLRPLYDDIDPFLELLESFSCDY